MQRRTLFLSLFYLVFCPGITDCILLGGGGGPLVVKTVTFSHPSPISHSIMNPIHAMQIMNNSGIPKDLTNYILRIHWLLERDEREGWEEYLCLLNSRMSCFNMHGNITMVDVMSLTRQEKENFQLIGTEVFWSDGDETIGLNENKFKKMPLHIKNKFKYKSNQRCICM